MSSLTANDSAAPATGNTTNGTVEAKPYSQDEPGQEVAEQLNEETKRRYVKGIRKQA